MPRAIDIKRYPQGDTMRHGLTLIAITTAFLCFMSAAMAEDAKISKELEAAMKDIAVHTKVVVVDGGDIDVANFGEDNDPGTLELVMLAKPADGTAHVSNDGEVIFMQKDTPDEQMQSLFSTAFYLKAKARVAAKKRPMAAESSTEKRN